MERRKRHEIKIEHAIALGTVALMLVLARLKDTNTSVKDYASCIYPRTLVHYSTSTDFNNAVIYEEPWCFEDEQAEDAVVQLFGTIEPTDTPVPTTDSLHATPTPAPTLNTYQMAATQQQEYGDMLTATAMYWEAQPTVDPGCQNRECK